MDQQVIRDMGLITFIALIALAVNALLFDWWLEAHGWLTITDTLRAFPAWQAPLFVLGLLGLTGLFIHFNLK